MVAGVPSGSSRAGNRAAQKRVRHLSWCCPAQMARHDSQLARGEAASPGSGHFALSCSALTLHPSCVVRLNEKSGLTCLCCGRIDDVGAAVAIAGRDECRRHVITE